MNELMKVNYESERPTVLGRELKEFITLKNLNGEIFLHIPNYSNYMISNNGIILSTNYNKTGLIRELKIYTNRYGYKNVELYDDNKQSKRLSVHRLVANTFIPKIEGKDFVNHKDGNKANNCYSNLEWVTSSENTKHSFNVIKTQSYERLASIGRNSAVKMRKFSQEEIFKIRELHLQGKSYGKLATMYCCGKTVIERIVKKSTYAQV